MVSTALLDGDLARRLSEERHGGRSGKDDTDADEGGLWTVCEPFSREGGESGDCGGGVGRGGRTGETVEYDLVASVENTLADRKRGRTARRGNVVERRLHGPQRLQESVNSGSKSGRKHTRSSRRASSAAPPRRRTPPAHATLSAGRRADGWRSRQSAEQTPLKYMPVTI